MQDGLVMDQQFARLVDALAERFAGVHERDTVARVVSETRARLEAGSARDDVPADPGGPTCGRSAGRARVTHRPSPDRTDIHT